MKRFYIFLCIFLFLGIVSCKDKDEISSPEQFPQWLQLKISELTAEHNICEITDVTIIEYKGKKYYHIYCGLWSCMYCQLFDENGNSPTWNTEETNDFYTNKKEISVVPACQ